MRTFGPRILGRLRGWFLCLLFAACGSQPSGASFTFDPCDRTVVAATSATDDQRASIDDAIAMWHARGVVGLVIGDQPAVTIAFRDAADAVYGFYDATTATVYVNLRLEDRTQRAITVAHELGHALSLDHVAAKVRTSVMNIGNVAVPPTDEDAAELAALWGACPHSP